jgi:GcrA cell cycle regulator
LLELKAHSCRWPVGDPCAPEFFFCGGPAVEGLPYCGHHAYLAYEALRDRRREHRAAWR